MVKAGIRFMVFAVISHLMLCETGSANESQLGTTTKLKSGKFIGNDTNNKNKLK